MKKALEKIKSRRQLLAELEAQEWGLKKTNEAVRSLYNELEKKNRELQRMDELKSQFVANVSHEFKNPLAMVAESMSLVIEGVAGEANPKQKELLETGRKTVQRLIRLVMDLLDVSKIEAGKMEMKREELDFVSLVEEVLAAYDRELSKKQLTLKKELAPDTGMLWADKDKLSEVVINLLNNAIKYTPQGGAIAIRAGGSDKEVRFEIADTGPGIPVEYKEKIFDKFERITAEKQEGTGLGLPIAKDIIALHKGRIWAEGAAGQGSRFIFTLPRDLKLNEKNP